MLAALGYHKPLPIAGKSSLKQHRISGDDEHTPIENDAQEDNGEQRASSTESQCSSGAEAGVDDVVAQQASPPPTVEPVRMIFMIIQSADYFSRSLPK
jgi:hypothetical protein